MRFLYKLPLRFRSILRKTPVEQELSAELSFHLEKLIEEYAAKGVMPEEARYAALREMGAIDQIKEECRDMRRVNLVENLIQDLRYALRMQRKSPAFTVVAVLTLALGIGANTAVFSLIDAVMLRMLPVSKPEELLQVRIHDPRSNGEAEPTFTNPLWEQIRDQQDVFSGAFAWGGDRFDLSQGGAVHLVSGLWVSGDLFSSLGVRPAAGRLIAASDDRRGCPAVAVLSYGFWQDHYGGANSAVGSILSLNSHPFEVIGVAAPAFTGCRSATSSMSRLRYVRLRFSMASSHGSTTGPGGGWTWQAGLSPALAVPRSRQDWLSSRLRLLRLRCPRIGPRICSGRS